MYISVATIDYSPGSIIGVYDDFEIAKKELLEFRDNNFYDGYEIFEFELNKTLSKSDYPAPIYRI